MSIEVMRMLVTGFDEYIGAVLRPKLLELGFDVRYDLSKSHTKSFNEKLTGLLDTLLAGLGKVSLWKKRYAAFFNRRSEPHCWPPSHLGKHRSRASSVTRFVTAISAPVNLRTKRVQVESAIKIEWGAVPECKSILNRLVLIIRIALVLNVTSCSTVAFAEVVLREVDGGSEYYSHFSNPLPSDPKFFPLGVWFGSVVDSYADLDKDAGLNLYVLLTRDSNLSLVERNGMRAILQESEWRTNQTAINSPAVVGWMLADEIDMQQGPNQGYAALDNILAQLPNDHRMRYNNYGKGVMFWETDPQAERFVNDFQDIVSADIYWFTDPNVAGASEGGELLNHGSPLTQTQTRRAANYGYTVDRMRALNVQDGTRKPIWSFVEMCWPFSESAAQNGRAILPAEIKAAVWHSIIAGARGIIYFNHSFGGPNPSQHCLREPAYAAVRASVKSTNELVTQLAPVLNAPFANGFVRASASVRTMAKVYENKYYVFAGSKENESSTPTLWLSGVDSGTATVVGENRAISISGGQFSDSFADGNAIHIYKIDSK